MYEVFEWDGLPQGWKLRGKLLQEGGFSYNIETGDLKGSGDRLKAAAFYAEALKVYEACRFTVTSPSTLATLLQSRFNVEVRCSFTQTTGGYYDYDLRIPSLGVSIDMEGRGGRARLLGLGSPLDVSKLAEIQTFLSSYIIQGVNFVPSPTCGRYLGIGDSGGVFIKDSLEYKPKFYWEISPEASPSSVLEYLAQSDLVEAFQSLYNNFHRQNGWPSKLKTSYDPYMIIDKALQRFQ